MTNGRSVWLNEGFRRLPNNAHGYGGRVFKKNGKLYGTYSFMMPGIAGARAVIGDYLGRYAVRKFGRKRGLLSVNQWKRRVQPLRFFKHLEEKTNHPLGNPDWYKELISYI